MKPIPRDIDELMWAIADKPTDAALADFEVRFPEFRGELGRRLSMVRSLRSSHPQAPVPSMPKFLPRPQSPNRVWPMALAAVVLATIGFTATRTLFTSPPAVPEKPPVTQVNNNLPPGAQSATTMSGIDVVDNGTQPPAVNPVQSKPEPPPYTTLGVRIKGVPVSTALQAIAAQAGISVEIAPGLSEDLIDVDFNGLTAPQMFEQLGTQHGFTALEQEYKRFLIVPARPNSE